MNIYECSPRRNYKRLSGLVALLMAAAFFKEKITVRCVVGLIVAFVGLLIINLL